MSEHSASPSPLQREPARLAEPAGQATALVEAGTAGSAQTKPRSARWGLWLLALLLALGTALASREPSSFAEQSTHGPLFTPSEQPGSRASLASGVVLGATAARWLASSGASSERDLRSLCGSHCAQQPELLLSRARDELAQSRAQSARWLLRKALLASTNDVLRERVGFLLAHVELDLGRYESALERLQAFGAQHPLRDYLELAEARALRALGRIDEGLLLVEALQLRHDSPLTREAALERLRLMLARELGPFASAAQQNVPSTKGKPKSSPAMLALEQFLARYPDFPAREELLVQRAQLFERAQQWSDAQRVYEALNFEAPWTQSAEQARERMSVLSAQGHAAPTRSFDERLERARKLRRMRVWQDAHTAFEQLLEEAKQKRLGAKLENGLLFDLAQNYFQSSQHEQALVIAEQLYARPSAQREGVSLVELRRMMLRSLAATRRFDEALALYDKGSRSGRAAELERAAFLEEHGRFAEAYKLEDRHLTPREKNSWEFAFLAFLAAQPQVAVRAFEALRSTASRSERARYDYWLARSALDAGDEKRARSIYGELLQSQGLSYYGVLAASRLAELNAAPLHSAPAQVCLQTQQAEALLEARSRLRWRWRPPLSSPLLSDGVQSGSSTLGLTLPVSAYGRSDQGALRRLATTYGHLFPNLLRASFLFDVGWDKEARREARLVVLEYRGLRALAKGSRRPSNEKPWRLDFRKDCPLVDNARSKKGAWGVECSEELFPVPKETEQKRLLAQRQRAILDELATMRGPLIAALAEVGDAYFVRRFAQERGTKPSPELFPRAFPQLILQAASEYEVEPYLLWTLMRIESSFNPDSISVADARGLLQVIPMTGRKIAAALQLDPFGGDLLLDEQVSVRFGAYYIAALLRKFNGQDYLAMAGYNGGPHNVARWLAARGHAMPMDAFVETIPYPETRNYVKKGTGVAASYMLVHEGSGFLYVGNQLDPNTLADPNY